jgi:hypothetical protein
MEKIGHGWNWTMWMKLATSKRHWASCSLASAKFHKIPTPQTNTAKENFQRTNYKETLAPRKKLTNIHSCSLPLYQNSKGLFLEHPEPSSKVILNQQS